VEAPQVMACPSTGRSGGARAGAEQEGVATGLGRNVGSGTRFRTWLGLGLG